MGIRAVYIALWSFDIWLRLMAPLGPSFIYKYPQEFVLPSYHILNRWGFLLPQNGNKYV